jgi:hypothetical protein
MTHTELSERARSERLRSIRTELLERLRPVCRGMAQDQFFEMVESMAALQLKYEIRGVRGP